MAFTWIGKSADGNSVVLNRLDPQKFKSPAYFNAEWDQKNAEHIRFGAVIDVETTGLSHSTDQVIEVGLRQFKFNRTTGEILSLGTSYSAFQDPGEPLSEEIKQLTGITDEQLKGQSIDWERVNQLVQSSHLVIAHNASFDRPFIDQSVTHSGNKIWACTLKQIDWAKKGFSSPKLDLLSIYHGYFTDSHRALNDADSLLYLLSFQDSATQAPYFLELLDNAKKPTVHVIASNSPFESKDHLKNRNYRWDGQNKFWSKHLEKEQLPIELSWLETVVYKGAFRGRHLEIQPVDQFKADQSKAQT